MAVPLPVAPEVLACTLMALLVAASVVVLAPLPVNWALAAPARPVLDGTFVQNWLVQNWDDETWEKEFAYLAEAGMTYLIVQGTADGQPGGPTRTYYPTRIPGCEQVPGSPDLVEKYLYYARKYGLKVFLGLNMHPDWWRKGSTDREWLLGQMELGNAIARELYERYFPRYPDTFYGWYWAWEIDNVNFRDPVQQENLIEALNLQLDFLTALDSRLPFMFSPFMNSRLGRKEQYRDFWIRIFAATHLREGDIFCPQDGLGGGTTVENFRDWLVELRKAVDTKPGLHFWSDLEIFDSQGYSAPLSRVVLQLQEEAPLVDNIVSFAYTHYYSPNVVVPGFHRTYLDYLRTGQLETNPPSPPANLNAAALSSGGVLVYWEPAQDEHGIFSYEVYRDGELVGVNRAPRPNERLDSLFWESFVDTGAPGGRTFTYRVRAVDFAGNRSEWSEPVEITTPAV